MDERQTKEKKIKEKKIDFAPSAIRVRFNRKFNDAGCPIKEQFRWAPDKKGLVKVGEIDLQAKIDAESKGMTASEQICRILRGDTSSIPTDDPLPPGDYCLAEEMTKEEILAANLAPVNQATAQAQDNGMTLQEMEDHLKNMLNELKAAKAASGDAPKEETHNG